ncbi:MAG: branched-chain amino acid ABC transporter permease [Salinirussus sp.]
MSITDTIGQAVTRLEENGFATRLVVYAVLAVLFLFVIPNTVDSSLLNVINRGLIFGLFAMGYDFMYGYSGMVSFGHAGLFGVGGYTVGIAAATYGVESIWLLLLGGILMGIIYALIVGIISIRTRAVYFAILTLAFAEVFRILMIQFTDITGGFDGLVMNFPAWPIVPGLVEISVYDTTSFYYVVVITVAVVYLILRRLTQSPMGAILRGIRENIERLAYIGIDERRYRIAAFTVSGAVSGLAGALYAIDISFIGPNVLVPVMSGEVILWTIIGGKGTLLGPVFGGTLIYFIEDTVSAAITWWLIPVGLFFVAIVILAPSGIAGWVRWVYNRLKEVR